MYKLAIPSLFDVSAPSMAELETLIARALALRESNAPAPRAAVAGVAQVSPNLAKYRSLHPGGRMRMSAEEVAEYGNTEEGRERCAMARLLADGETLAEGGMGGDETDEQGAHAEVDIDCTPV